ncbi:hypothetical protein JR316_0001742 [Psilocybe cubensis]|uniref:Uncharacterized protein n=2 Tax=Psilocybe cubensis TaxID=181762 RepID=A0A8H8CNW9_PSICU|nr:hypothetical protein JR316_0001742 [Psilocybe cubensis]KAH9484840.1 hypothetical protein JR316_0001742 [Psilocybe cubensis]
MGGYWRPLNVVAVLLTSLYCIQDVSATAAPYLNPGFQFVYDNGNQALPIPVTTQCDKVRLRWSRDTNSTGPLPVAPYSLLVFTSTSSIPYSISAGFGPTFDFQVPFAPNTQYQICMFDTNGVSGGCQQRYTVIASNSSTAPTCQNVTAPSELSVSATVPTGAMSQFSYIDQCNSLTVTPKSGSPPYTLTIAPDYHPPYNITSNSMDPISWQVSLPVGFRFFLSLTSSDGSLWANGPMRVGGLGPSDCLVPGSVSKSHFESIVIGASIGGLFFGVAAGALAYFAYLKFIRRRKKSPSQSYLATAYASGNNPSRPLTAPSLIGGSTIVTRTAPSIVSSMPTLAMPAMPLPTTPPTRSAELPLEPVRHPSSVRSRRPNRSVDPYDLSIRSDAESVASRGQSSIAPTLVSNNNNNSSSNNYPLDVKRPLPPSPGAVDTSFGADTTAESMVSSSSYITHTPSPPRGRPVSVQSRAPTYVPRSTNLRGAAHTINETEDGEMGELPPEYGRHTNDPSLNYAPSVLSSGNRFNLVTAKVVTLSFTIMSLSFWSSARRALTVATI